MLAGHIADQQRRGANSEFSADGFTCNGVWPEEVEVISVRDHLYPIVCVAKLFVEGSRCFRNANNPAGQVTGQRGARLCGPDRVALIRTPMQLAVTDVPDEPRASGELGG